ncbi:Fibulin-7 [Takifugu flavidus]|uniref:Fibulin-7 n=1 Tax=Takifugu flavidus TaxID=433684 RepID=A0A5C6P8X4_9TELE|nr:Fibulin-7 [Takifugu flavidus]
MDLFICLSTTHHPFIIHLSIYPFIHECPSSHHLLSSLQQLGKMLADHEVSYRQSLHSLKKKISNLHNSTTALIKSRVSCPKRPVPAYGRRLGRVFAVGHEVYFVCTSGYKLIGPRSRMCLQTRRWSGQQPEPQQHQSFHNPILPRSSILFFASSILSLHLTVSLLSPLGLHPLHLPNIDECRVFLLGQPGRLCIHHCVNSPGSFSCFCPAGYDRDGSSCTDVNECETQIHNCSTQHMCVNTFGGFQCVTVSCPSRKNATYIKTSPVRCEKNPCMQGDKGCLQTPNSISFHFLSVVSNMSAPRVLFRVSAARVLGDTLRFGLAGGSGHGHFSAEVEMSELENHYVLGRYITKVMLFVSAFDF